MARSRYDESDVLKEGGGEDAMFRSHGQMTSYNSQASLTDDQRASARRRYGAMRFMLGALFVAASGYFLHRLYYGVKIFSKDEPISGQIGNIHFETNGTDPVCRSNQHTYSESQKIAKQHGGRLCTSDELKQVLKDKKYLSEERSYAAVMDNGQPKWIDVGRDAPGSLVDAGSVKWTENYNIFEPKNLVYPYWVGTTLAWCPNAKK